MNTALEETSLFEKQLPQLTFTEEKSSLEVLNSHFSHFENRNFLGWLGSFSETEGKVEVLEIGGGVQLVAAQELLERFENLYLTEVEKRKIDDQVREDLQATGRLTLYQNGFSEVISQLEEKRFDIVFLHNVLPHLPNPFSILERCFNLLREEGLLFANGILIYEEEWDKIISFLEKKGFQFSFSQESVPSELRKKGIVSVSLTLKRDKGHNQINFPVRVGDFLTDFSRKKLGPREIYFGCESY